MDKNWMELANDENQISMILKTNDYADRHGLSLSREDAKELTVSRKQALKTERRVEFGEGIMPSIIREFCDSAYISQSNYKETLQELQDIFYLYKNEMLDEITDDELIHFMKEQFETICYGDTEYLAGTCLSNFAAAIRAGYNEYIDTQGYGAYRTLDKQQRWDRELFLLALDELTE